MKSLATWCLAAGFTLVAFSGAQAADETAKGAAKKKGGRQAGSQFFDILKEVELTAEQQEKLGALKKEWGPKLAEVQAKVDGVLSKEQIQARRDAMAKAKEDKIKGKELQARVDAALNLSAEQKAKWETAQAELRELQGKVREQLASLLTDEQKAKVPALAAKKAKKAK